MQRPFLSSVFISCLFCVSPAFAQQEQPPSVEEPKPQMIAVARALDKITARITELELPVGESVDFGALSITARYCRSRPPEETPETFTFLEIDDRLEDGTLNRVFSGWMLASSPALHALEHPVYDVWVISCKAASPEESGGSE